MDADALIKNLESLIAAGRDGSAVRFGLGNAYLGCADPETARTHLERAVELDPHYSAAWKLLGKSCEACTDIEAAAAAYEQGISAASAKGDRQSAREMEVFLRRLRRG